MTTQKSFDVIVIGGGAAGLSAALTLARARRSVLVIDAGEPRNAPAAGVHNFLTRDGMSPAELVATGRAEVLRYGGTLLDGSVVAASGEVSRGFEVTVGTGEVLWARRLIVTSGIVDELPDLPGLASRFGRDAVHCPYCHGWEIRDRALVVIGATPFAAHQALLFSQWTRDVTLVVHDPAGRPSADDRERLAARGVRVVDEGRPQGGARQELHIVDDALVGVRLASGEVVPATALAVAPLARARAAFVDGLGLAVSDAPMGTGTRIEVDAAQATSVLGVWAAGNVTDASQQVVAAAAGGVIAGARANVDLLEEETAALVAAGRAR